MILRKLGVVIRSQMVGFFIHLKHFLAALLLCSVCISRAQSVGYDHVKFSTEDGLPSSEVYEIIQDRNGYLWFATDAGVSCYNGYEFKNYSTKDGLTDNTVFHFYEDDQGRIWFLTFNSQLSYFENDSIHHYQYNEQLKRVLPAQWIRAISIDSTGALTFAGNRYGIGKVSADGVVDYQLKSDEGRGIVGTYSNGDDLVVYGLGIGKNGPVNEVLRIDGSDLELPHHSISHREIALSQFKLGESKYLLGVGGNICYYEGGEVQVVHVGVALNAVYIDSRGRIWVACYNDGIKIFEKVEHIFDERGPVNHIYRGKNISHLYADNEDGLWLAVQNSGLFYISDPGIEVYSCGTDELSNRVSSLYVGANGRLYAGSFNGNVYEILDDQTPRLVVENATKRKSTIYRFSVEEGDQGNVDVRLGVALVARNGGEWSVGNKFLRFIHNGDTTLYADPNRDQIRFNAVFEDQNGAVWAGSNSSFYKVVGTALEEVQLSPDLLEVRIEDIDQLQDGRLVIATKGYGLILRDENEIKFFQKRDGLSSDILKDVHVDAGNDIWVCTSNGLNLLRLYGNGGYVIQPITSKHGLSTNEVNRVVSIKNQVWIASNEGVVLIEKDRLTKNNTQPPLLLNHISINELHQEIKGEYAFPHDQNYIEIGFTALSYRSQGNVRYRYKMEGIDEDWIESYARSVRYPSLANGEYIFRVQAANEDGVWSEEQTIRFTIHPPFWKTWWFVLLCVAVTVGLVAIIVRTRDVRRRKKAEQERILEQQKLMAVKSELKALRAQMNPHFTFNTLSAIQTAVNNADTAKASKYIVDFATLIRKVLENSKNAHIKLEEELEMLQLYVELEQLRFSNRFQFDVIVDERLDASFVQIPSMVIQPYVENAIIHGLAPKIEGGRLKLKLEVEDDQMICIVEDNGIGRSEALKIKRRKALTHNSMAIEITEERLDLYKQEIGEEFSVKIIDLLDEHQTPNGTRVELVFPI